MKFLFISILAALILAGCSKQSTITEPQKEVQRAWLKLNIHPDQKVENDFTASKLIDGSVGGQLNLSEDFYVNGKNVTIDVELDIPAGAFSGTKQISYTVNNDDATIDFSPKMAFDKDLTLNYKLTGVDLSSYNPDLLDFVYLKNHSSFVLTSYLWKKVDSRRGLLEVFKAKIAHFSRYGWATITDPDPDPTL